MANDTEPHLNGVADDQAALPAAPLATDITEPQANPQATQPPEVPAAEPPPAEPAPPSFDDLGLHPDVKLALDEMGYFTPTAVQTAVYKPVSEGKDLLVQSRTGTGKTTAFGLPTISKLIPTHRAPQALILAPTRELALQVSRELTQLGKHRGILVEPIYGGAPIGKQIKALRDGVHIIVGTPGRVLDHIGRRTLDCSTVQTFILDECDEMLSMGFLEDIERVVSHLPDKKQTLLFSATMPDEVTRYARRHMRVPEQISLSRDGISVNEIHHAYYIVSGIARSRDLLKIIFAENPESAIIFCNTRDETTMVARFLQKQGLDAEPLSSDLAQNDRERVMGRMKQHSLRFLCATDVAARGIDISNLSHVINYSVPESPEIYVHRTGRTGRAGKKGTALSLVGPRELGNFRYVRLQFGIKPEERLLPKDEIFIGRLKVPLPPIGIPQPPDPVQILIRGTPLVGTGPSDLEMKIFEKLYASTLGKRVIAQLVAERLNQLSTRSKPRRADRPERIDRGERPDAPDGGAAAGSGEDRGDRPRFERDRGERPDRGDRGDRPWRDREDRGERRFDRDRPERGERGDRPRGDGDRPWRDRDETRGRDRYGRDRDRGDRGDRPDRGDRGDRPRDRFEPRAESTAPTAVEPTAPPVEAALPPVASEARPETDARGDRDRPDRPDRPDRGERGERRFDRDRDRDRDRYRDRGERRDGGDRDRSDRPRDEHRHGRAEHSDRSERIERPVEPHELATHAEPVVEPAFEVGTEAAPVVETLELVDATPTKVDEVARAVLERVDHRDRGDRDDRGDRKGKRDKRPEPTAETREFWETWAEEKTARTPEPRAPEIDAGSPRSKDRNLAAERVPAAEPETVPAAEAAEVEGSGERRSRGRDRGRDKDKGRARGDARPEKSDKPDKEARHDKTERSSRLKRDTAIEPPRPPVAAGDGAQARLFVSLGKKHGVSADDLRLLLAGPIGGDKGRIGSVSLRDSHAHVRVPEEHVEAIISGVHGTQHNAHDVTVERART